MSDRLRDRIYGHYVSGGQATAPSDLSGLASRLPFLRDVVVRHFPSARSARVLDLGCGYGGLVHAARSEGYSAVEGIDVSAEQVAVAERLGIEGISQGELLETLRARDAGSLDAVLAFDVLEHLRGDELIDLVDEVLRVLRPGGRLIAHVPNGESPFVGAVLHGDLTHERAFTRLSITELFRASGFASVECYEDVPIPHGLKSRVRRLLWPLVRAGLRFLTAVETGDTGASAILSRNLLAVAQR